MDRTSRSRLLTLVLALVVGGLAWAVHPATGLAQGTTSSSDDPSPHSSAELVSAVTSVAPGQPFTVALRLQMEDGWHSYWKNPGDSGQPTAINWSLPAGMTAGDIQWPYPHRIEAGPLTSYGYSDEVHLLTTITPSDTLTPGRTATLTAKAEWLICADICLPAEADVELSLPVKATSPAPSANATAIREARAKKPQRLDDWTVQAARSSGSYTLALTPPAGHQPDLDGAYFFADEKAVLDHAAPQPLARSNDTYLLTLQQSSYASSSADTLTGTVVAPEGSAWDQAGEVRALRVEVPVDSTLSGVAMSDVSASEGAVSSGAAAGAATGGLSLPWALLFALAGGVLLNLMPCVFPVLSVKILGFARQADGDPRTIRKHGLLFGAGVLVSMWVLAGGLMALRAAGSQVGWGFQLQSPSFIALMTLLFFGIGLNLLGVFEVGTRVMNWGGRMQSATPDEGSVGAFFTGVLATVVATPCTAPFMGAALGAALTLSTAGGLLVFTALGAGMAAPYVALSMAPRLLERLPKPGSWMETLKQAFAFPMFATAIWLVWVFGQQTGNAGIALLLFGLLLVGLAAWIAHRWSAARLSQTATYVTRGLAAALVVGGVATALLGAGYQQPAATGSTTTADAAASTENASTWMSYDASKVEELRASGQPVFIDFTAAWCLTCQVNKRTVLSSEAVQSAFAEHDVALVRADWTNRDADITSALQDLGRSGVPVYALYPGDGSEPKLLPEVLTTDIVRDALRDLPDAPASRTADASSANRAPSSSS
jgi:thiol:disulfide interchange protein DsbD